MRRRPAGVCSDCGAEAVPSLTVYPRAILAGAHVRSGGQTVYWCQKCWDANVARCDAACEESDRRLARASALIAEGRLEEAARMIATGREEEVAS